MQKLELYSSAVFSCFGLLMGWHALYFMVHDHKFHATDGARSTSCVCHNNTDVMMM